MCVTPGPTSASLVRATRRMAASLRAPWIAVHVETPADARLRPADRERLAETLHLARRLGGEVVTLGGTDVAGEIVAYARQRNVTKIIVGKTLQPRWRELVRGSFVYELARRCGDIDVYVISGDSESRSAATAGRPLAAVAGRLRRGAGGRPGMHGHLLGALSAEGVGERSDARDDLSGWRSSPSQPGMAADRRSSRRSLGVLAFDFFFVQPYWTFAVSRHAVRLYLRRHAGHGPA